MTKQNEAGNVKRYLTKTDPSQPIIYQIRVEGHLGDHWKDQFGSLTIMEKNGETLLTGPVADQAALFGLLKKIRNLGLPLISLNRVHPAKSDMEKGETK